MKKFNNSVISVSKDFERKRFNCVIWGKSYSNKHIKFLIEKAEIRKKTDIFLKDQEGKFYRLILINNLISETEMELTNEKIRTFNSSDAMGHIVTYDTNGVFKTYFPKAKKEKEEVKDKASVTITKAETTI